MKTLLSALVLFLVASVARAQDPDAQRAAIDRLGFMVGAWEGEGWALRPDGSQYPLTQTQRVARKASGLALVIDGEGRDKESGRALFSALATIYHDFQTGEYRMYGVTSDGLNGEMDLELLDDGVRWLPRGWGRPLRYTTTMRGDAEWFLRGEFSPDGSNWTQFLEMTLHRIDP